MKLHIRTQDGSFTCTTVKSVKDFCKKHFDKKFSHIDKYSDETRIDEMLEKDIVTFNNVLSIYSDDKNTYSLGIITNHMFLVYILLPIEKESNEEHFCLVDPKISYLAHLAKLQAGYSFFESSYKNVAGFAVYTGADIQLAIPREIFEAEILHKLREYHAIQTGKITLEESRFSDKSEEIGSKLQQNRPINKDLMKYLRKRFEDENIKIKEQIKERLLAADNADGDFDIPNLDNIDLSGPDEDYEDMYGDEGLNLN